MRALFATTLALAFLAGEARADDKAPKAPSKPVSELVKDLADKNPDVRAKAAEALGDLGDALNAKLEAGTDKDGKLNNEAKEAKGALQTLAKASVTPLIAALKDDDDDVRDSAAEALGEIGEDAKAAVPALTDALKDKNARVRSSAAEALGEMGEAGLAAVPGLLALLKDSEDEVREAAATSLNELSPLPASATLPLAAALKDKLVMVRELAADALGDIGPDAKAAVPALIDALKDKGSSKNLRRFAAEALGSIKDGGKATTMALAEATKDEAPAVRCAAADALGDIALHPKEAVPALVDLVKEPKHFKHVRYAAAVALGSYFAARKKLDEEEQTAKGVLEKVSKEPNEVGAAANAALARINKK